MKKSNNKFQNQNVKVMPSLSEGDGELQDQSPKSEQIPDLRRDGDWSSTPCSVLGRFKLKIGRLIRWIFLLGGDEIEKTGIAGSYVPPLCPRQPRPLKNKI